MGNEFGKLNKSLAGYRQFDLSKIVQFLEILTGWLSQRGQLLCPGAKNIPERLKLLQALT